MLRFAALLAALLLVSSACADSAASPRTTPDETRTPSATPDPTEEPTPTEPSTPEPTPTETPTPTPMPEARFDQLEHDDVLVVVTDDLVVRSEPEVSDASRIHEVMLQAGDLVRYRDGPVRGSGFEWIEGEVVDPARPDGRLTGWIAVGDNERDEMWLAVPRQEGDGWRLLGMGREGMPFSIGVATTTAEYQAEWAEAVGSDEPPPVDFEAEIVVRFTHAVPSTCPDRDLHGIGVDRDDRIVYSAVSMPIVSEGGTGCTTDATPWAYIVAVEREIIPSGEVTVRLERGFLACPDCGRDAEQATIEMP